MRNPSPSLSMTRSSAVKPTTCGRKARGLKRGPWTLDEDSILADYINRNGEGNWRRLPKRAGLLRCGKSCQLRWMNYLRPSVKRGCIEADEEDLILRLHRLLGNRWSLIAGRIPGRTDNEIKNYWNSHLRKKLISQGIDPKTHLPLGKSPTPTSRRYPDAHNSHHTSHGEIGRCDTSYDNLIDAMLGDGEVSADAGVGDVRRLVRRHHIIPHTHPLATTTTFASQNQPAPLPPSNWGNGHQAGWGTW